MPAQFGDALGGFEDVLVYDCMLDMYANRVNLEINAEVKLELFNNNWVKAKLYTNKEDNADGKKGEFLCSVAPTLIEDSNGEGIDTRIDGDSSNRTVCISTAALSGYSGGQNGRASGVH